ncbi:membrane protein YdbS with pleckstrin-like domain [Clostridium algifaecis]|uniref:Membrane protein YdbS with pleckstrin-like domain n=1 Tax=Clostridium algifaecis TaxID=1472040 RepID=A0ABS4KR19_9CLOT|nr:PH domain-containing protein [Clostridium algifaecis]MBP2032045.1 membrane protein YdbS with pleckstrin-like domain [Clostridium algifaecis]
MNYNKIDENAIKSWIMGRTIASIIFVAIYVVGVYLFLMPKIQDMELLENILNILTAIIIIASTLDSFVCPFLEYKQWRYGIFEDKIELINGIIIRKKTIIPISRIQNLKIEQGPIERMSNIASVNIITAGGRHKIPAITMEDAEKITDNLKRIIEFGDKIG